MSKRVVYIAGPFRSPTGWGVTQNIRQAEEWALEVWKWGGIALCPHLNTANFSGALPDEVWLQGDLELLRRCDAVLALPRWYSSTGASVEAEFAETLRLPVFEVAVPIELEALRKFLEAHR